VCPYNFYGDDNGYFCTRICYYNRYADPTDKLCKDSCLPRFQYNYTCVDLCPNDTYAKLDTNCVIATSCDADHFGDNTTKKCLSACLNSSYADPNSRLCIAICPQGWYG